MKGSIPWDFVPLPWIWGKMQRPRNTRRYRGRCVMSVCLSVYLSFYQPIYHPSRKLLFCKSVLEEEVGAGREVIGCLQKDWPLFPLDFALAFLPRLLAALSASSFRMPLYQAHQSAAHPTHWADATVVQTGSPAVWAFLEAHKALCAKHQELFSFHEYILLSLSCCPNELTRTCQCTVPTAISALP